MKKILIILLAVNLSLAVSSCEGQVTQKGDDKEGYSIVAKQLQAGLDTGSRKVKNNLGIDFREAARKVTPCVVHVNSKWKAPEDQPGLEEENPFRDFFGDEFWGDFLRPFRDRGPRQGTASGVILTSDGYIITNNHVIDDADEIEVVLHDQRSYEAKVVGTDPKTDLALLKIDETNLSFLPYGNSDDVEVGEWVLAVGNPFNLASTVTAGIVSAKARNINILKDREAIESFIQTDAAVNPGNSGGALVNLDGQLIGINAAIATPTGAFAGYSFAIPVNIVKKVADDLLQFGSVQRGYLGIMIRDMTGSLAKDLDLKFTPGVYVDSLVQDGAAAEAGLKQGDVITHIDGTKVETSPQLQEIVARHRPGEKLQITLSRKGQEKKIPVVLKGTSGSAVVSGNSSEAVMETLGIGVQEITAQQKKQLGIQHGLKVTRIVKGKVGEYTTMKEGFIITRINNIPVQSKDDLIKIIRGTKGGVLIEGIYPGSKEVFYYGFGI